MLQPPFLAIDTILQQRYQIKACLSDKPGRQTYLAEDRHQQEQVIIKCLSLQGQTTWENLKLFEREAQVLQSLDHEAIPRYIDSFELADGQGYALVQSFIPVRSLKEQIETGTTFSVCEVQALAQQLLEILQYLHERHPPIVHRDLKPSNVLWNGKCYLVDFGAVQTVAARAGETFTIIGTYGYMPPEQFGGRTIPASDLYSLGATLIYLLTGIHPSKLPQSDGYVQFEGALPSCSPAFRRWIRTLMQPNPTQRFVSAQTALDSLTQINTPTTILSESFTRIKIYSNADELKVVVPQLRNQYISVQSSIIFLILYLSYSLLVVIWKLSVPHPVPHQVNLSIYGIAFILYIIVISTIRSLTKVHLLFTLNEIILTYDFLGLKLNIPQPAARSEVVGLAVTEADKNTNGKRKPKRAKSDLLIWTGEREYRLRNLSQREAQWISEQISQRLNLPVTVIRV